MHVTPGWQMPLPGACHCNAHPQGTLGTGHLTAGPADPLNLAATHSWPCCAAAGPPVPASGGNSMNCIATTSPAPPWAPPAAPAAAPPAAPPAALPCPAGRTGGGAKAALQPAPAGGPASGPGTRLCTAWWEAWPQPLAPRPVLPAPQHHSMAAPLAQPFCSRCAIVGGCSCAVVARLSPLPLPLRLSSPQTPLASLV